MARSLTELFREASELREEDRAMLAGLLIESLDPAPESDVEAAWEVEIQRRVGEIEAGTAELIPWEVVREELFGRRDAR